MAESDFRGPLMNMGSLELQSGTAATIEPMDGPAGSYQGFAFLDPRGGFPFNKDGMLPGRVPAFVSWSGFTVDNKPQALATNVIASAFPSNATASLAVTLVTTGVAGANAGNPSIAQGVPLMPLGTSTIVNVIALDFGFTTGTTTASSTTVSCNDNTQLQVGQWIIIGNVGNSANTASLITQVQSISSTSTTTITVLPAPAATLANAPIGGANLFGSGLLPLATQFGPSAPAATAHAKRSLAGMVAAWNPKEALCRNVTINLATGGTATAIPFLVTGYDIHGQLMTELITSPATTSSTTTSGKKTFKYIASVVQNTPVSGNTYSVGVGDVYGLPLRADEFEQTTIYWAGTQATASTGFTAPVTSAASNTTGDVRGTWLLTSASNGTSRLAIVQDLGVWNIVNATPLNPAPLLGVNNA
jgi:hypothetical protein